MSEIVSVSRVLNRIADMIDFLEWRRTSIELIDVDPAVVSVSRITEPFYMRKIEAVPF